MTKLPAAPNRAPYEWEKSRPLVLNGLTETRRQIAVRRAHAMSDGAEEVVGIVCRPLTLKTHSLLLAHRSEFLLGRQPTEADVRNYLWFHSPLYADSSCADWKEKKRQALSRFEFIATKPWRRWVFLKPDVNHYAAMLALAVTDIRALIDFHFMDATAGDGRAAPCASLHAQFVAAFASSFGWSPEYTENLPLRKVFQLDRAMAKARGMELREAEEDMLLAEHLLKRQQEVNEGRKAQEAARV